ncbi:CPBP family intramembrane glutamic endopeptidase [Rhodanobacter sp. DHB23]|uniref:CPBP family intramembrane glutamic endopeptidase n=1 Tax=Rhodanobacter sp. DHB23 TaxID=2775923 RepID=UPI00178750F7|nr:CPBP family intramembrane glutamic endopeptidase [Rhodanobacter sp. DHB23]MBD8874402.1 CPBP family intramembrane metalloprotease [Rhodanobacter sp. DHB23]
MRGLFDHLKAIRTRQWLTSLVGLLLALGVVSLPFGIWDHEFAGIGHLLGNEAIWWTYVAVMLLYVRRVERRPLSSVGFRPPGIANSVIGVLAGAVVLAVFAAMYFLILPALHLDDSAVATANGGALMATPWWWRFISTVRAAVAEELLFRGYAMGRIEELTGSRAVATMLSLAVFTVDHVTYWGWSHELIVAVGGLAFSLLYLWRRNLWVNIIAHFIVDAATVL